MNRRDDLLELTPQALAALANAGFVKRAQREVAAGQLPTLTIDGEGVVTAVFDDGVETRFPPGVGLADAHCNCPASGMCRHRVTLVLAWQAGFHADEGAGQGAGGAGPAQTAPNAAPAGAADAGASPASADDGAPAPAVAGAGAAPAAAPVPDASPARAAPDGAFSPADFDDAQLATALGATALAQAARFAAQQPTIRVLPWQGPAAPPLARLPMCTVRFFSRHNLQLARCDCVAGGRCAHVALAVWAFRQARPAAGEGERVLTLRGPIPFGAAANGGTAAPETAAASDGMAPTPADPPARKPRVSKTVVRPTDGEAEYSVVDAQGDGFGLQSGTGLRACQSLDALLTQLWLDGAAQPQLALAGRIAGLRVDLQALGWQWLLDALDELEAQLHALAARSTRFEPTRLLHVSAELWARWRCARHQWQRESTGQGSHSAAAHEALPAAEVLGRGVRGEVLLDHLRLVSLGGSMWSDVHAEGASVFLADPDTQTVLVLEREWPRAEAPAAAAGAPGSGPAPVPVPGQSAQAQAAQTSLLQRRVVGVPLRQLLDSQIVTKAAKRRANGVVDIGGNKRQTGVLPLSASAWDELSPPLAQNGVRALDRHLRRQIPPFAAPRHAASGAAAGVSGSLHVVRLAGMALAGWWWDGAAQTVHAVWQEAGVVTHEAALAGAGAADGSAESGNEAAVLHLQVTYQPEAPGAVDALARALAGDWGEVLAIAGPAWRAHGEVRMQATAMVCAQRALALAAQPVAPRAMPAAEGGGTDDSDDLRDAAVRNALDHLAMLLRDGLRHQGGLWPQTVAEHAQLLRRAGFAQASQAVARLPDLALNARRDALLPCVSRLSLLLRGLQAA